MNYKSRFQRLTRAVAAASCSGVLFASSCGSQDLRTLANELETLAVRIDEAEDVSFEDFLLSQLKD